MGGPYRIVEQIGDLVFAVAGGYPSEAEALFAAVDLVVASDEERDLSVDGPTLTQLVPVGRQHTPAR